MNIKKCNKITKSRIFEISKVYLYSSKKYKYINILSILWQGVARRNKRRRSIKFY